MVNIFLINQLNIFILKAYFIMIKHCKKFYLTTAYFHKFTFYSHKMVHEKGLIKPN